MIEPRTPPHPPAAPGLGRRLAGSALVEAAAAVALATSLSELLRAVLSTADVALLHLTAIGAVGIRRGVWPALAASALSVASMSFFVAVPRFSLRAERPEDWLTLFCFAATSLVTGSLSGRIRQRLDETRALAARNERLYETSRLLAGASSGEQVVEVVRGAVTQALGRECWLLLPQLDGELRPAHAPQLALAEPDRSAARRAFEEGREADAGSWAFFPLAADGRPLGVLALASHSGAPPVTAEELRLLRALRHLGEVALDRQRLADEIRAAQMLTETEKLRAALLSSVSHDLRTPLASIMGAASALEELRDALPLADQHELLSTVLTEAARLDRFVDNLLYMTRIEYGGLSPRPSWCDLRDVIAHAARGLSSALDGRELEVTLSDDFPLLCVDAVLLERVIENLIDNAAKYSAPDAPLRLSASLESTAVVIRLIDQGPGIPRHERESVFTLFHRVRETDKRAAGTGLGLAICRGLVEALGGELSLQDGPGGKGLCAEIRLPLRDAIALPRES